MGDMDCMLNHGQRYQPWPMTAVAGGNLWSPAPQPNDDDSLLNDTKFCHILSQMTEHNLIKEIVSDVRLHHY